MTPGNLLSSIFAKLQSPAKGCDGLQLAEALHITKLLGTAHEHAGSRQIRHSVTADRHMARIPAKSRLFIPAAGCRNCTMAAEVHQAKHRQCIVTWKPENNNPSPAHTRSLTIQTWALMADWIAGQPLGCTIGHGNAEVMQACNALHSRHATNTTRLLEPQHA